MLQRGSLPTGIEQEVGIGVLQVGIGVLQVDRHKLAV